MFSPAIAGRMDSSEEPASDYHCHCEERSDVTISWNHVRIGKRYQEIAAACGLAMTVVDGSWFFCFTVDWGYAIIISTNLNLQWRIKQ